MSVTHLPCATGGTFWKMAGSCRRAIQKISFTTPESRNRTSGSKKSDLTKTGCSGFWDVFVYAACQSARNFLDSSGKEQILLVDHRFRPGLFSSPFFQPHLYLFRKAHEPPWQEYDSEDEHDPDNNCLLY